MRSTNTSGRESARLSVSASREVDEKGPNRTLDVHELFTDTMPASVGDESPMCLLPADWDREVRLYQPLCLSGSVRWGYLTAFLSLYEARTGRLARHAVG
jgi:hypothetical protein